MSNYRDICIKILIQCYNTYTTDANIPTGNLMIPRLEEGIYSVYSHLFKNDVNVLMIEPYIDKIAILCLALSQDTYVGYYNLLYNQQIKKELASYIYRVSEYGIDQVNKLFYDVANKKKETIFAEIFENDLLTEEERQELIKIYEYEYKIMYNYIHKQLISNNSSNIIEYYNKDFKTICISYSKEMTKIIYYRDTSEDFQTPFQTFCADAIQVLIGSIDGYNPLTNKSMSDEIIELINEKYPVELKIIKNLKSKIKAF